ncbi:hypothetical protein BDZ97DRAFT_1755085 [Flammula alnicola]|nr:hypothetical protein BDZ97DRAFT_1755085 [Flammula alnicola]
MSLHSWFHRQACRGRFSRPITCDHDRIETRREQRGFRTSSSCFRVAIRRDVWTLDPKQYAAKNQQRIFLQGTKKPSVHVHLSDQSTASLGVARVPFDLEATRSPWPEDAMGFLYYHNPPNRPRIAGELRFRATSSDDPSTFATAKDFCLPSGQVWTRPLFSVATQPATYPLYQRLLQDGFVPPDLDKSLQGLPRLSIMYSRCQLLYDLQDTFLLDLSRQWHSLMVITEKKVVPIVWLRQFLDNRIHIAPYKGTVLARFERSNDLRHEGTQTIVLRFLKFVTPVECIVPGYDDYFEQPQEGELFSKRHRSSLRPWSVDLKEGNGKTMLEGLRLLWDATFRPGG